MPKSERVSKEMEILALREAINGLLRAVSWDEVQEVGGEPLRDAIEMANLALTLQPEE